LGSTTPVGREAKALIIFSLLKKMDRPSLNFTGDVTPIVFIFRISDQLEEVRVEAARTNEENHYYSVPPPGERINIYETVELGTQQRVVFSVPRPTIPPPAPPAAAAAAAPPASALYASVNKETPAMLNKDEKVMLQYIYIVYINVQLKSIC
jgi:hypothetical protein